MCDTFLATPSATIKNVMILAKNSDRHPNEAQNITFVPAKKHKAKKSVKCTYIKIPQVSETYACILSRPFWMFGAEMGVNEHSVAIGNEAVLTTKKYRKKGLTGMDLLRLALERSKTAKEAVATIKTLIKKHGQGGNCGYKEKEFYHNSYIIADPKEAYILETADSKVFEKKVKTVGSISNELTIKKELIDKKAHAYKPKERRLRSLHLLKEKQGKVTSKHMMKALRDHGKAKTHDPSLKPNESLCRHAGLISHSQTAGSMVAVLHPKKQPLVYFTGTAAPCLSTFKPHTLLPNQETWEQKNTKKSKKEKDLYGSAKEKCNKKQLWWNGEITHRKAILSYPNLAPKIKKAYQKQESDMIKKIEKSWGKEKPKTFQKTCKREANKLLKVQEKMSKAAKKEFNKEDTKKLPKEFLSVWEKLNKQAKVILN